MILVIVISTPNENVNATPVMKEVKKTMSYARMSSHLLSPLIECEEDSHAFIIGSRNDLQPTVRMDNFVNYRNFHGIMSKSVTLRGK